MCVGAGLYIFSVLFLLPPFEKTEMDFCYCLLCEREKQVSSPHTHTVTKK